MTFCPSPSESFGAISRATMSEFPPAENGEMMRTGRDGYGCANATPYPRHDPVRHKAKDTRHGETWLRVKSIFPAPRVLSPVWSSGNDLPGHAHLDNTSSPEKLPDRIVGHLLQEGRVPGVDLVVEVVGVAHGR